MAVAALKFLCDRCKTRYSIADERVRGKILKIRCKNCSAVISVREGMEEPTEWSAPPAADAAPSIPGAAASPAAAPPVLAPVRPPASLQEEWYVSLDGNQEGPFSLPEAQAWISAKGADDELHCWSEGFDDWLPVEKVSHFRGLRGKVTRARPPTRPGGVEVRPEYAPPEPEPKPLFAATLAAIEADVARDAAAAPAKPAAPEPVAAKPAAKTGPVAPAKPGPAIPAKPAAAAPAIPAKPAAAAPPLPTAKPAAAPLKPLAPLAALAPDTPTPPQGVPVGGGPSFASGPLPVMTDAAASASLQAQREPSAPHAAPVRGPIATTTLQGAPAVRATLPRPGGNGASTSSSTLAAASPSSSSSLSAVPSRPAPAFDTGPSDSGAPELEDDLDDAPPPPPAEPGLDEDDLSIGEVSRVVRLADIARQAPPRRAAAAPVRNATASTAAIARGTGAVSSMDQAAAAPAAAATAAAEAAQGESIYASITTPPPRRRTALYVGLAAAVIAIVAVVVVVATSRGGDDEGDTLSAQTRNYDELGFSVDDPSRPQTGTGPATAVPDKGTGTGPATNRPRNPGTGTARASNPGTGTAPASDKVETPVIGPDGQPIKPLTPDDVFAMSNRMEIGTRRCYERALKDDPFLKVTKIKAMITVSKAGTVSNVSLSSMQGTPLATCLTAAIGRWRFRASTEGIVSEFALVFEQR